MTEGIPLALNYYKEISINPEKTNTTGYLILSNQPYNEGPILCALYDKGKVINTKGKLEFNTIDDSDIKQQYGSSMLLYNVSSLSGSAATME